MYTLSVYPRSVYYVQWPIGNVWDGISKTNIVDNKCDIYMCNIYLGTWCKCQYDCVEEYLHWTSLYMAIITTSQAKEGIMQSIKTKKKEKKFLLFTNDQQPFTV